VVRETHGATKTDFVVSLTCVGLGFNALCWTGKDDDPLSWEWSQKYIGRNGEGMPLGDIL